MNKMSKSHSDKRRNPLKTAAKVAIVFLLCCLVFGGAGAVMIKLGQEPDAASNIAGTPVAKPLNILVVGQDEGVGGCLLVRLDYAGGSIPVVSFPPELTLSCRGRIDTLSGQMAYGGVNQVASGLSETLSLRIDRYIVVNRSTLVNFIDRLGGIDYTVDRPISYGAAPGEQTNTLEPGSHNLTGIMAAGLLSSDGAGRAAKDAMLADICVSLINQYMSSDITNRAEALFTNIVGQVKTDVSFADLTIALLNSGTIFEKAAPAYALSNGIDFSSGGSVYIPEEKIAEIVQKFN